MTDATIGVVYDGSGFAFFVLFYGFLWRAVARRLRVLLEGLSQIMIIVVGGLVAATEVIVVKAQEALPPHNVVTWFLEYPIATVLMFVVWVILFVKGRPLREARERVPVLAFIGPGGGGSRGREQRWRDKFNEALEGNGSLRVLMRGVGIVAAATVVLVVRGVPRVVSGLAWVLVATVIVAIGTWFIEARGGRSPFDDP